MSLNGWSVLPAAESFGVAHPGADLQVLAVGSEDRMLAADSEGRFFLVVHDGEPEPLSATEFRDALSEVSGDTVN